MAISPILGLQVLMGAGAASLMALRIYGGVTAPEIPSGKLREIARIFNRLADDIDGGKGESASNGIADRADKLAVSVWSNPKNSGPAVEAFRSLYMGAVAVYPAQLAKDCRVVAIGCEAYAHLVDDTHKRLAELDDLIMQILWAVAFQPMTTALYGIAAARMEVQIVKEHAVSYPDEAVLRHVEDGLDEVTGEGEAADGLIRAVTDPAGGLLKLVFNPRVMRMDSHALAEEAAEAVRRAQADGQRKTRELVGGALGPLAPERLPGQGAFWDGLREIREAFDRSMTEQEAEVARRLRALD